MSWDREQLAQRSNGPAFPTLSLWLPVAPHHPGGTGVSWPAIFLHPE